MGYWNTQGAYRGHSFWANVLKEQADNLSNLNDSLSKYRNQFENTFKGQESQASGTAADDYGKASFFARASASKRDRATHGEDRSRTNYGPRPSDSYYRYSHSNSGHRFHSQRASHSTESTKSAQDAGFTPQRSPEAQTHYDVLGVSREATTEEIRAAYKRKALEFHPDKNPSGEAQFKHINTAYQVLYNSAARAEYDRKLQNTFAKKYSWV